MNRPENNDPVSGGKVLQGADKEGSDRFAAPLGSSTGGRLEFGRGAADVTIHADSATANLYRARFEGPEPRVQTEGGTVNICYPRTIHPFGWHKRAAEVTLNALIPWDIEIHDGASRLTTDLRGLELRSFKVSGGASRVELTLPPPSGTVLVRVLGGASNVAIHRPEDVAAWVRVVGGSTNLAFDEKRFGVVGGEVSLRSPDYDGAPHRYDIVITGGASNLTIDDAHLSHSTLTGGH
jgi:hypothetical protein